MGRGLGIKHVLVIALIFRISILFPVFGDVSHAIHNDTASYLDVAINLINGNGYSHCINSPYFFDSIRTPVYPLFLSLFFGLFDNGYLWVVLAQIIIDLGTVFFIYKIGDRLYSRRAGQYAALFYALCSHGVTYAGLVIPECLYTFLLTVLIYGLVSSRGRSMLFLVVVSTILCYLRPISMYALVLFIPYVIWYRRQKSRILVPIFTLSLLLPWMFLMQSKTGYFTFTSISSYNVSATYANALTADINSTNETEERNALLIKMKAPVFGDCEGDYRYIGEMKEEGLKTILDNPLTYVKVHLQSWPNAFLPEISYVLKNWGMVSNKKGTLSVINQEGLINGVKHYFSDRGNVVIMVLPLVILWLLVLGLFIMGIVQGYRESSILLFLFVIVFYSLIPGPATTSRFLMPVVPLICLIAGMGLHTYILRKFDEPGIDAK